MANILLNKVGDEEVDLVFTHVSAIRKELIK